MRFPRLQFHLSTAIVLMFVAGALLWANLQPRVSGTAEDYDKFYGWPDVVYWTGTEHWVGSFVAEITDPRWPLPKGHIRTGPLVINAATAR